MAAGAPAHAHGHTADGRELSWWREHGHDRHHHRHHAPAPGTPPPGAFRAPLHTEGETAASDAAWLASMRAAPVAAPAVASYVPPGAFSGPIRAPGDASSAAWLASMRGHAAGSIFDAVSDVADAVGDVATSAVDVLHKIPGVDQLGDAFKQVGHSVEDFARTDFGATLLRAASTAQYAFLAPYLGPQLAGVAFATPGVLKGDAVGKALVDETLWRVSTAANILSAGQGGDAVKAWGEKLSGQVGTGIRAVADQLIKAGAYLKLPNGVNIPTPDFSRLASQLDPRALAKRLGIREDMAQLAIDQVRGGAPSFARPAAPPIRVGQYVIPAQPARPGLVFDPLTGRLISAVKRSPPMSAASQAKKIQDRENWARRYATIFAGLKKSAPAKAQKIAAALASGRYATTAPAHPLPAGAKHVAGWFDATDEGQADVFVWRPWLLNYGGELT
jgi:hypothetical protein